MKYCTTLLSRLVFSILICTATSVVAAPYEVNQAVAPFDSKDQHEQAFTFKPADTNFLLVTHDMATGKSANAVLTEIGQDKLAARKVVYMANIFGMPGIGRFFAFPKMKKYAHRIILADDAELITRFPVSEGKVTVLALSGGKVTSIKYWNPASEPLDGYLK